MKNKKNIFNTIIITIMILLIIYIAVQEHKEEEISIPYEDNLSQTTIEHNPDESIIKQYPKEEIITEYNGYQVSAKLEIPEIDLETYILQNFSSNALNVSVTKFWGSDANQIGNFCVAGHNFLNKNMFHNLKKLNIGDTFWVSDNEVGKIKYEIYDIYKVIPKDVSCLSQETNGKREVTLITCTSDSKKRIIIKAREIV